MHEYHEQARERGEDALRPDPKFPRHPVKRPDDGRHQDDEQDHLEDRPIAPRHRRQSGDLVDRPGPDQLHEAEDRRNPLLQKMHNLAEYFVHGRFSRFPARLRKRKPRRQRVLRLLATRSDEHQRCRRREVPAPDSGCALPSVASAAVTVAPQRKAAIHLSWIARASSRESAEVRGNSSFHANGLHASMIIFECEVSPRSRASPPMRGSSAELQAWRTMSTDSDGSQRVAIAHMTSARSDGSTSSSTVTTMRPM